MKFSLERLGQMVTDVKSLSVADDRNGGPEDVACDLCTQKKALKSCLTCMVSFCEEHLQPHDLPQFERHELVKATKKLQASVCPDHKEVRKVFCRTDQQLICHLCCLDKHKRCCNVTAAEERAKRQKNLDTLQTKIQQGIKDRLKDVTVLQKELEFINLSADKAVGDGNRILTELISFLEKQRSGLDQQIRSQQEAEVSRVKGEQKKLTQEVSKLRREQTNLKQLSSTEDHSQFLLNYPKSLELNPSPYRSLNVRTVGHFTSVIDALEEASGELQGLLRDKLGDISWSVTQVDTLLPQPDPTTRADFLRYSRKITLDPNTAHNNLVLSDDNRMATLTSVSQAYTPHPDRFSYWYQVLSAQTLTGRCYWEVDWQGDAVRVAVAHASFKRRGLNKFHSDFGNNSCSWALYCNRTEYALKHDKSSSPVLGARSNRIGVYLDSKVRGLSFYRVSDTMTLLTKVRLTSGEPLRAGLWLYEEYGDTAEILQPKRDDLGRVESLDPKAEAPPPYHTYFGVKVTRLARNNP